MSAPPRQAGPRTALLLVLLALAAWLLAQACTLLWQGAESRLLAERIAEGEPRHAWYFDDPDAVVAAGSEGLDGARHDDSGLHAGEGQSIVDLSLELRGAAVAGRAYGAARLVLDSAVPARVLVLAPAADGSARVVAESQLAAGAQQVKLALSPFAPAARWLRLRVERQQSGPLLLRSMALVQPRCETASAAGALQPGECRPGVVQPLPPRPTPEQFLRLRDALMEQAPAAVVGVAVPRGVAVLVHALRSPAMQALALLAALLVLAWAIRKRLAARGVAKVGGARQLLPLLAVPVALLLCGQPDRDDSALVLLALLAAFAAALLHPGGRRDWHWLGTRAAWWAALRLTAVGVLLIAVIAVIGIWNDQAISEWKSSRVPRYLAWALLQQALLLVAIMPRLTAGGRDPRLAAVIAGGLFALLHLPNFVLMLATLLAGSAWATHGHRHGALLPLALSHALLGTLFAWLASPWLLRSAEVATRYLMPP